MRVGLALCAASLLCAVLAMIALLCSDTSSGSVWWLPSLSLEVSRVPAPSPPLDALAQQMQQMFPQLSLAQLAAELRSTRDAAREPAPPADSFIDGAPESTEERPPFAPTIYVPSPMAVRAGPAPRPPLAAPRAPAPPPPPRTSEVATSTTFIAENRPEATRTIASTRTAATEPVPSLLFPKDSNERERHLQFRKQAMIEAARRKYLDKLNATR